jgi:Tol biopolymer transport system component
MEGSIMKKIFAVGMTVMLAGSVFMAQSSRTAEVQFKAAQHKEEVEGDLKGAIEQYKKISEGKDRRLAAQALLRMAEAYQKLGDSQARAVYARIVRDYTDQKDTVAVARTRLGVTQLDAAMSERAVWTGHKVDSVSRVSPDGRFISFADWFEFNNLSLYDFQTGKDRPLTGNKGWAREDPNWGEAQFSAVSPDGQYVAYGWFPRREVRIVPVSENSDRQPRTLLKFDAPFAVADWSPDGKLLAVNVWPADRPSELVVANVSDGAIRVIKRGGGGGYFFSRDSRYIAGDRSGARVDGVPQRDVFILAVDGSREVVAVEHPADDSVAGWSPDGKYLLFTSTRTDERSLWALPVSEGRPKGQPSLVKTGIGSSTSLGVTNKGALHFYKVVSSRDVKIARIDLQAGTLVGEPVHFSRGLPPDLWTPHWSPDGRFLAYPIRNNGSGDGLAIRSVDTGEARWLRNPLKVQDLRWSPDGRSLIAKAEDSKNEGIFQIDVQSGRTTFIVPTDGGSSPRWAADSSKIYYLKRGPQPQILERDLRTGVEREVFSPPSPIHDLEVSPDGRHLAVRTPIDPASSTSSVWVVPIAGGEPREVVRIPAAATHQNPWSQLAWTPDSRALLTVRKPGANVELWLVEIETRNARKLNIDVSGWTLRGSEGPASGFALSPDGQSIAFLSGEQRSEVWALENLMSVLK